MTKIISGNYPRADIGVLGGSGFYSLLTNPEKVTVNTPYGQPSAQYMIGKIKGKRVAFLPRHGEHHQYPPHQIPYLANLYGFKELGVRFIISPCAAGSLHPKVKPGDFVISGLFFTFYSLILAFFLFFSGKKEAHGS